MKTRTWRSVYVDIRAKLQSEMETRRIVERAAGVDGKMLYQALDEPAPHSASGFAMAMADRRLTGEPLQYVLGEWGFRDFDVDVDGRVLIPRPETELVTEVAIARARKLSMRPVVADLGTGSGVIALSIATEIERAEVWATDNSADALAVARDNLSKVSYAIADRVRFLEGSWFEPIPEDMRGQFHLIVSNPPYIADAEPLPPEVSDWEPHGALYAGPTGFEQIEQIIAEAPEWLSRPAGLVVELAPHQADEAMLHAEKAGFYDVQAHLDMAQRPRILEAIIA